MLAAVPAAALMKLPPELLVRLEIGLLAGTPGLAALTLMTAALTAGLRGAGALGGLLMLPLAVPILIFGAGMGDPVAGASAVKLLAAASLLLVALTPFAAGARLADFDDVVILRQFFAQAGQAIEFFMLEVKNWVWIAYRRLD